jgi:hypothetical protein
MWAVENWNHVNGKTHTSTTVEMDNEQTVLHQ